MAEGNGPYVGKTMIPIIFSSSRSYDPDGEITEFLWNFGDDVESTEPNPIQFNSTGSTDLDGNITECYWIFGDGTDSPETNPVHAYSGAGAYNVSLTVTDDKGTENTIESQVEIEDNLPPIPVLEGPTIAKTGKSITFSGVNSSDVDGALVEYLFDFGDNTFTYGSEVSHVYYKPGAYNVSLIVTDDQQSQRVTSITCFVYKTNPPEVIPGGPYMGVEGEEVFFNPIISDVDGQVTDLLWDFGDGSTSDEKNPVHVFKNPGQYNVFITLFDSQGKQSVESTLAVISQKKGLKFPIVTSLALVSIFSIYFVNRKYDIIDA
jgi:PKD repeat protein